MNCNNDLQKISHIDFIEMLSYYALSTKSVLNTKITASNEFWYLNGDLLGASNKNGYYAVKNKYMKFRNGEENAIKKRHRKN